MDIWKNAPSTAFHWERFPTNGECVWHCRVNGKIVSKKAPDFNTQSQSLWRDPLKQQEADRINMAVKNAVTERGIKLA